MATVRRFKISKQASFCVKLFLLILAIYIVTLKIMPVSDCQSNNYLPWLMTKKHTITCDYIKPGSNDYMYYPHDGHYYSTFSPGVAFAALPVYAIPSLFIHAASSYSMEVLAKISASTMMALAGVLMFLIAFQLSRNKRTAIIITVVFSFGTGIFAMASQMLLTFTGAVLFLVLGTYCLVKGNGKNRYLIGAGFCFAYAGFCQPVNFVFLLLFGLYVLRKRWKDLPLYALGAVPPVLVLAAYNYVAFGSPFKMGDFVATSQILGGNWSVKVPLSKMWTTPLLRGLTGTLFSPSRGIFVFSPVLIFAFVGLYMLLRIKGRYTVLGYGFIGCAIVVLTSAVWWDWLGGNGFGYRVTLSAIPFLCLLLVPAMPRIKNRRWLMAVFAVLLVFSIFVQVVGYLSYDGGSWEARNLLTYKNGKYERTFNNIWSFNNNQLVWEIKSFHFYVAGPWQASEDNPARDTKLGKVLVREVKPGSVAVGVETSSPRIAVIGIVIYHPDTNQVLTNLTMSVPRGKFIAWTEPISIDETNLKMDVGVSNVGVGDEYGIQGDLNIETLLHQQEIKKQN